MGFDSGVGGNFWRDLERGEEKRCEREGKLMDLRGNIIYIIKANCNRSDDNNYTGKGNQCWDVFDFMWLWEAKSEDFMG